jgi:Lrp/AsnC family leucine-responsive transcriptional regulator
MPENLKNIVKLDLKDRKILSALDENARMSLKEIGKRSGLSKQAADYRIKNMLKNGVIKKFTTIVDVGRFGYSSYAIYLSLLRTTSEKEKEIINFVVNHPYTRWVVTSAGKWDMKIGLSAKGINHFNNISKNILDFIGENVADYDTNVLVSTQNLGSNFLFKQKERPILNELHKEIQKIDEKDVKILEALEENCRSSLIEISKKVGLSPDAVNYRLKALLKNGIILRFIPIINIPILGYNWYEIFIDLKRLSESEEKILKAKLKTISNLHYIVECIGKWNFEIHICAENNEKFRQVLMDVRNKLGDYMKSYGITMIFENYKNTTLPKGVIDDLLNEMK